MDEKIKLNDQDNNSGRVASYYTSPLALRNEYKAESGYDIQHVIDNEDESCIGVLIHYIKNLEGKLVRKAGK